MRAWDSLPQDAGVPQFPTEHCFLLPTGLKAMAVTPYNHWECCHGDMTWREAPVRMTQPESGILRPQPLLRCWHHGCCLEPGAEAGAWWRGRGRERLAQEKEGKCMLVCPNAGDGGCQEARGLITGGLLGLWAARPRENCPWHTHEHYLAFLCIIFIYKALWTCFTWKNTILIVTYEGELCYPHFKDTEMKAQMG